jgi:hypothetical protein
MALVSHCVGIPTGRSVECRPAQADVSFAPLCQGDVLVLVPGSQVVEDPIPLLLAFARLEVHGHSIEEHLVPFYGHLGAWGKGLAQGIAQGGSPQLAGDLGGRIGQQFAGLCVHPPDRAVRQIAKGYMGCLGLAFCE